MGSNLACCSADVDRSLELNDEARIQTVTLQDSDGDAPKEVLALWKDSLTLHASGDDVQAVKKLRDGYRTLESLPESESASRLLAAYARDPELQLIKEKLYAMEELENQWEEAPEVVRYESSRRASELLLSEDRAKSPEVDEVLRRISSSSLTLEEDTQPDALERTSTVRQVEKIMKAAQLTKIVDGKLKNPMDALQRKLDAIFLLCLKSRVFEAFKEVQQLEMDAMALQRLIEKEADCDFKDEVAKWCMDFKLNPKTGKLKQMHGRLKEALNKAGKLGIDGAENGTDSRWVKISVTIPEVDAQHAIDLFLRRAEGSEVDPNGPGTQLIGFMKTMFIPLSLSESVAVDREVDLFQPELMDLCEYFNGTRGGADQLQSVFAHTVLAPPIGSKVETQQVREFAKCDASPFLGKDRGCGILCLYTSLPGNATEFEGWKKQASKTKKDSGASLINFYTAESSDHSTLTRVIRIDMPIPSWMLPLSFIQKIFPQMLKSNAKKQQKTLFAKYATYGFRERIAEDAAFYESIHRDFEK